MKYNFKIIIITALFILYLGLIYIDPGFIWVNLKTNLIPINKLKNVFIRDIQFLTPETCYQIKCKILNNKKHFIKRNILLSTLGNASYQGDVLNQKNIDSNNKFLYNLFPELYTKLITVLQQTLKRKVIFKKDAYLPGFHIFGPSWLFNMNVASFHVDLQYEENNIKNCDTNRVISFTLPIDLPQDVSGLYMFQGNKSLDKLEAAKTCKSLIKYKIGTLYIHDGSNYHIMKPSKILHNEYRITLQGHGILCQGIWNIYW